MSTALFLRELPWTKAFAPSEARLCSAFSTSSWQALRLLHIVVRLICAVISASRLITRFFTWMATCILNFSFGPWSSTISLGSSNISSNLAAETTSSTEPFFFFAIQQQYSRLFIISFTPSNNNCCSCRCSSMYSKRKVAAFFRLPSLFDGCSLLYFVIILFNFSGLAKTSFHQSCMFCDLAALARFSIAGRSILQNFSFPNMCIGKSF